MGTIRKVALCFLLLLMQFSLFACENNFHKADISLYKTELVEVQAHSGAAYFLSNDGALYCTGVDSDTASFVVYQNPINGLVAENVTSFGEIPGGGYYIDRDHDLYIWNENSLPVYGYTKKGTHAKILDNVIFAAAYSHCIIYIDKNSNLYLMGTFHEQEYSVDNPKLLAKNVSCADINNGIIIWANINGGFGSYGKTNSAMLIELNSHFSNSDITDICITSEFVTVLSNNQLWYYGDYSKLTTGDASGIIKLTQLGGEIKSFSCSRRTIFALDSNLNAWIWGACVSNDAQNTKSPQFEYYNNFCLAENVINVFVSDSSICYVDKNGSSNIFYSSGWPEFYGNSTNDLCVGIKREPNTWIN